MLLDSRSSFSLYFCHFPNIPISAQSYIIIKQAMLMYHAIPEKLRKYSMTGDENYFLIMNHTYITQWA